MTKAWLWQFFKFKGRIVYVYVSRKVRKETTQPFAFVRFSTKEEALRAMKNLDGLVVRGFLIEVKEAEFNSRANIRLLNNTN